MSQARFRAALLDPDCAVPEGLIDPQGRPAGKRFAVYRNNVAVGLTEALEVGFPVLRRLVGMEFFAAMAGVFLRAHPPDSRMMMFYGAEMPDFLRHFPPVAHLPYLPDVARLELALRAAYHAADRPALAAERLAALPPERFLAARLQLAPALRLIVSDWPIHAIWRANTKSANTRSDAAAPAIRAESVVVLRPEFDPVPHLLAPGAAVFLAALLAGETVGTAMDKAGEGHDLSASLTLLLNGGAIVGLHEVGG
ncbi:MAG: DNA-binding domain-containing protein [Pseudorhodobacter sp.]|nr:DNA-binding domain-containing protein [Pseudorhodobacter sp.]